MNVDAWFDHYENPQRMLVMAVRDVVLEADPRVTECIKWRAPTLGSCCTTKPSSCPATEPGNRVDVPLVQVTRMLVAQIVSLKLFTVTALWPSGIEVLRLAVSRPSASPEVRGRSLSPVRAPR